MRQFLTKVLLFGLVIFIVDKAFLYFKHTAPNRFYEKRLVKVLAGEIDQDIVVIGSSRGVEGINAWVLEDSLDMSAYNLSFGGSKVEWQLFITEALLEKANPKVIIKIIDEPREWMADSLNSFRMDLLYPLVKYPKVLDTLVARGEKNGILSKLFVTHQLSKSAYDLRPPPQMPDTVLRYGSQTKPGLITEENKGKQRYDQPYSAEVESASKHEYFARFQALVKASGAQLLYVMPPNYQQRDPHFVERVKEVIGDEADKLYVFNDADPEFNRDSLMRDPIHLNPDGALFFTRSIVPFLRKHIKSDKQ